MSEDKKARLGYLLTEEQTDHVMKITGYMGISPHSFLSHCITTMIKAVNKKNER